MVVPLADVSMSHSYFRKFVKVCKVGLTESYSVILRSPDEQTWYKGKLSSPSYLQLLINFSNLNITMSRDPVYGHKPISASRHNKWSFVSDNYRVDIEALRAAREADGATRYGRDTHLPGRDPSPVLGSSSGRVPGPSPPSASDVVLARKATSELQDEESKYVWKRAKERLEEAVGPKEVAGSGC
jgi:hypothetical protein